MNSCDVYISLHRSEGLGLTLLESILLEKPTVCTNYSGNVDFCLPDWSELVEFRLVKVDEKSIYYRMIGENEDIYWAEPDIDDASKKLYKVYNNLNEYEKRAKEGKKWILENYDIKNISNIINDTINK